MSAERRDLLTLYEVTDHDCGNYRIGEVDWGIRGSLDNYLERYGEKGRDELVLALGHLITIVNQQYRLQVERGQQEASSR